MGAKDKFLMGAALVSIMVIGYMAIINYPNPGKELSGTNYYTSDETMTIGQRVGSSYSDLNGIGRVSCPGIGNNIPTGQLVSITGVTTAGNHFNMVYLPYTAECSGISLTSLNKSNFSTYVKNSTSGLLSEMFNNASPNIDGKYTEIVAPFAFVFETSNLNFGEGTKEIVISNNAGNCKMIINGYVNWYCAGQVGTETDYSNIEPPAMWEDHEEHHMTRIGKGYDMYETGSAGDLIAYGNKDTTVIFKVYTEGGWKEASLFDVCKQSRY